MRSQAEEGTGAAIRKLRLSKGLTLAELADQTGIPLSTLSRVELGQNRLNQDKLVRLCRALDVDLKGMVAREANHSAPPSGRRAVVRVGEGVSVPLAGNTGRRPAADLLAKALSPVVVAVTSATLDAHGPLIRTPGEAYVFVLSGEIVFHGHLYAPLPLGPGDSVYFDASGGYGLTAPAGPAQVLLIASGEQSFEA